ncbi:rRNA pseudouridine synthase [Fodinisporobacter ferrooxydans]|uniref:Pseudouridine synthase n=2 Tax=Fodinisporobacter ferrooxydans TaxID=2901836 RepID=A0ABY4CQZ7_9BACL|nr:rRNA pseudouridine synthase [Alicyclobacillaceae bacterium MYW30-H2]
MAQAGIASRRKCEEMILQGNVRVNGQIVRELGTKVNIATDQILVQGQPLQKQGYACVLLNKPTGYITTAMDTHNRPTVMDLVKSVPVRIYPVGRLDLDTSGLLLLTNDGELTNRLIHPRYHVEKTYRVKAKGLIPESGLERLESGVPLDDGITAPARLEHVQYGKNWTVLHLTIHEGRNRQVRRMLETIGHPVLELERIQMGPLTLAGVARGQFRHLTKQELQSLYELVSL